MEDALVLFASLMTQKGGGGVEAFRKTAYGYNVRHNYGMEGKKTSYSSASCGTLLGLPPMIDRSDCHGCPFRFRDEGAFRALLQREQPNPLGQSFPAVRPTPADIEDIIQDCKGQHFTRACYKHFMATHPTAKRDSLFRSPYEYYCCSTEVAQTPEGGGGNTPGDKRPSGAMAPTLNEDNVRLRTS
ncbi:DNA primase large subunit [Strigomonas culicis]|nr:DNA primase large subunit [Strigomonas culicis]|eukprot:EPY28671.1 DNA primase large subunit [Strigomonas culicis]